jgi:hypothetical protein
MSGNIQSRGTFLPSLKKSIFLSVFLSGLGDVRLEAVTEHMASISRNDLCSIRILFNDILSTV